MSPANRWQKTNSFLVGQLLLESGPKISIRWRCTYHHSSMMTNNDAAKVIKKYKTTKLYLTLYVKIQIMNKKYVKPIEFYVFFMSFVFYMNNREMPPKESFSRGHCSKTKWMKPGAIGRLRYLRPRCRPRLFRIICFQRSHNP